MKNLRLIIMNIIILFIAGNSLFAQKFRLITWDSLGQKVTIKKTDDYEFKYRNPLSRDWTFVVIEPVEGNNDMHTLILKTNSITPRVTSLPPDTVYIPCPGEGDPEFGFKEGDEPVKGITVPPVREVLFEAFGQVELVKFCESVEIIYDGIAPEDVQILYEAIDEGYLLHLKRIGERKVIEFKYLCQSFILSNPESTSLTFTDELRYEQIIWTPMENNLWEVRIGTTERKCKSRALESIKHKRTSDYESQIPRQYRK